MSTSLRGGINIAAASQFPLARRLSSSHLSLPPLLPKRTIYRRSMPFQNIYSLSTGWIKKAIVLPALMSNIHINRRTHMHMLTAPALGHTLLSRHRARPHTLVHCGDSSFPTPSIWSTPLNDLKSWGRKTSVAATVAPPPCLRQGVCICCSHSSDSKPLTPS